MLSFGVIIYFMLTFNVIIFDVIIWCYYLFNVIIWCYHFSQFANVIIYVLSFFLEQLGCYHLCYHLMLSFFVIISPLFSFSWKCDTLQPYKYCSHSESFLIGVATNISQWQCFSFSALSANDGADFFLYFLLATVCWRLLCLCSPFFFKDVWIRTQRAAGADFMLAMTSKRVSYYENINPSNNLQEKFC